MYEKHECIKPFEVTNVIIKPILRCMEGCVRIRLFYRDMNVASKLQYITVPRQKSPDGSLRPTTPTMRQPSSRNGFVLDVHQMLIARTGDVEVQLGQSWDVNIWYTTPLMRYTPSRDPAWIRPVASRLFCRLLSMRGSEHLPCVRVSRHQYPPKFRSLDTAHIASSSINSTCVR